MLLLCLTFIDDFDDKLIFENLFYAYRKQMIYLAMSFVHNQDDAEDIVHDVFLNIAQRHMPIIKSIHNDEDIRNYLLKATKNMALNKIREKKRVNQYFNGISMSTVIDLPDNDFIDKICKGIEYKQIVGAIESLGEIYRNSLYFHFVLEIPVEQVAKILNQSISTTKKQLVRGKKMLLTLLNLEGE